MPSNCRFGNCEIQPQHNRIIRGGEEIRIPPRVMEVLVYLIEHRDRVVSIDELLESFWNGRVVEESTIHRRISQIRTSLGDTARDALYIKTVSKRGYQAVADYAPLGEPAETEPAQSPEAGPVPPPSLAPEPGLAPPKDIISPARWGQAPLALMAGTVIVLVVITAFLTVRTDDDSAALRDADTALPGEPVESIGLLPFASLSDSKDVQFFAGGIGEAILGELTRVGHLKVASQTATAQRLSQGQTLTEIGEGVGVDYLLEGSVSSAGEELLITATLVRASDGHQVVSRNYRHRLDAGFDEQARLATMIAQTAHNRIWEDWRRRAPERFEAFRGVAPSAVDLYLDAQVQYNAWLLGEKGDLMLALELAERAAVIDPGFSLAHSDVAWNAMRRNYPNLSAAEASVKAHAALDRLQQRNPSDTNVDFMRIQTWIQLDLDYKKADALYQEMVAQAPDAPWWRTFRANIALREGFLQKGVKLLEMEFSGKDISLIKAEFLPTYAAVLHASGDLEKSLEMCQEALTLYSAGPMKAQVLHTRASVLFDQGKVDEARSVALEGWQLGRRHQPEMFAALFVKLGETDLAREILASAEPTQTNRGYFALGYQALGEYSTSLDWLREGVLDRDRSVLDIMRSSIWSNEVVQDPRFGEIMSLLESLETHTREYSEIKDLNPGSIQL